MQTHYFVAIKSPATTEKYLDSFKAQYQLPDMYKIIPHPEDLHVTLVYIGVLQEQSLSLLASKLQTIAEETPSFSIFMDGLSYFGSPTGPRVVYLSIEQSEALSSLQKEIDKTIAAHLDRDVSNQFTPHITIAKKRKTTDKLVIQIEKWAPIEIKASTFSLFKIHPEKLPKYEAIKTFNLN